VSISGTTTPTAPASSARPIGVMSFASTRTSPTAGPGAASTASKPLRSPA
jgi:hypothetical protein